MKALIQRTNGCSIKVENQIIAKINSGILVFLGISENDKEADADYLVEKIPNLRIFEDSEGKMNLSALDLDKEICIVSQFTLYGDCSQGRRPGFSKAAKPDKALKLYNYFVEKINNYDLKIVTGEFKKMMEVDLTNIGPATFIIKSEDIGK